MSSFKDRLAIIYRIYVWDKYKQCITKAIIDHYTMSLTVLIFSIFIKRRLLTLEEVYDDLIELKKKKN